MTIKEVREEIEKHIISEETRNGQDYPQAHLVNMIGSLWAQYVTDQSKENEIDFKKSF